MKRKRVYKILYGVMMAMLSLRADDEERNGEREEERQQPVGTADGGLAAPVAPVAPQQPVEEVVEDIVTLNEGEGSHEQSPTDFVPWDSSGDVPPQNDALENAEEQPVILSDSEESHGPIEEPEIIEEPQTVKEQEPVEETVEEVAEESPSSVGEDTPTASPAAEAEEEQPAEEPVEEVVEDTVTLNEGEGSHEQSPTDSASWDSSGDEPPQNDALENAEEQPQEEQLVEQEVQEEPAEETQQETGEEPHEEEQEEEIDTRFPTVNGLCFEWQEQTQTYTVTGVDEEGQRATQVVIPQELFGYPVTEIGDSAFRGCRFLTEVVVPEGVTKIGNRAFYGCYALEKVELPDSLTSVGDEMFYLCMAIRSQTEYDNAYYLGNRKNPYVLLSIHKSRDVDSCTIHPKTKFIDRGAFAECRSLSKIEIPSSVLGVGCKAFYRCVSLQSVTLGSGLKHIGDSAFFGCAFLRSVEYVGTRDTWGRITIGVNNEPLTKPVLRLRPVFTRPQ